MDHAVFFKDRDGRDIQDEEQRIKQILLKNASNLNNQSQNRNSQILTIDVPYKSQMKQFAKIMI